MANGARTTLSSIVTPMRENFMQTKNKDRVFSLGKVETFTRGSTSTISDRVTVKCTLKMALYTGDSGRMEIRREMVC